MEQLLNTLLDPERLLAVARGLSIVLAGLIAAPLISRTIARLASGRLEAQQALLLKRISVYSVLGLFFVTGLQQLGFNMGVLLGTAGVFTVAIGFASQTSASNLVSGLFLVAEKPFVIGDLVQIGPTTGEVLGIDLLSVKLRSLDNRFIRIPNETVIKSEVATLTRFPIRRIDLRLGVGYAENLDRVKEVLMDVADKNILCLDEPKPLFIFQGFGDSSMDLQFSVWSTRENYLPLLNAIHFEIKQALDEADIEIPFPHRTLYAGKHTAPIPVELITSKTTAS